MKKVSSRIERTSDYATVMFAKMHVDGRRGHLSNYMVYEEFQMCNLQILVWS
jgi:hypothetical protein